MNRFITIAVTAIVTVLLMVLAASVLAQQTGVPFASWPALYKASENAVVKMGVSANGKPNDKLYLRIGWGDCLAIGRDEYREFWHESEPDRYTSIRAFADSRWEEAWTAEDWLNCPSPPLELKPYWSGSRPMYFTNWDSTLGMWMLGKKSPYRVRTKHESMPSCVFGINARRPGGRKTNYWSLEDDQTVYDGDEEYVISQLGLEPTVRLVAICRDKDVDILGYRF